MKTINKYILLALVVTIAMVSCSDFLDERSKKELDEKEAYSNLELIGKIVDGLYRTWANTRSDDAGLVLMLGTDETQQGAFQVKDAPDRAGMDRYDSNLNADLLMITTQWNNRWPMINEAAKVIQGVQTHNTAKGTEAGRIYGEASFLRGFFMLEMVMYWGEVPIKDKFREVELGDRRQPINDVWEYIISDLQIAVELCSDKKSAGKANTSVALAMLGKAYMSAPVETGFRDFDKASKCFEQMMSKYQLVNYADLFAYDKPNTVESILSLQYSTTYPLNNRLAFQTGSRAVQSYFGDQCYFSGYDKIVPTKYAYETVENGGVWEDGDLRREVALRFDFTYDGITPDYKNIAWEDLGDDHDELKPHIKKYEDYRTDKNSGLGINNMWHSGKEVHILRLADIKLCYAECLNELGRTSDAVNIVNEVRTRAWGGILPTNKEWNASISQSKFRDDIMDERLRELFAEHWRRIDLIRTGKFVDLIKKHNRWANESGRIQTSHMLLPIPNTEIEQNPDMTKEDQNPGYR